MYMGLTVTSIKGLKFLGARFKLLIGVEDVVGESAVRTNQRNFLDSVLHVREQALLRWVFLPALHASRGLWVEGLLDLVQ